MKDWQVRALKTFVQAFLGVLIPESVYFLQNLDQLTDMGVIAPALLPLIGSALAAGISAAWNIIKEKMEADLNDNMD